jgi:hypothetical protein
MKKPKTGKTLNCKSCGKSFYIRASDILKNGNCCSNTCAARIRWGFRRETRGDRWTRAVSERIAYKLKHTPMLCSCGKLFIQTRGKDQKECLFCIYNSLTFQRSSL